MSIIKRDPFESLADFQDEIARWFGRPWRPRRLFLEKNGNWAPRTDVYEDGNEIVIKAEIPGVNKEDVEITFEDGDLVLKGERKSEKEVKEEHFYRMEREYGSFHRRIPLPAGITPEAIKATFKDGVLEIRAPRPAETKPEAKKITVG